MVIVAPTRSSAETIFIRLKPGAQIAAIEEAPLTPEAMDAFWQLAKAATARPRSEKFLKRISLRRGTR